MGDGWAAERDNAASRPRNSDDWVATTCVISTIFENSSGRPENTHSPLFPFPSTPLPPANPSGILVHQINSIRLGRGRAILNKNAQTHQ
ncbi:hypothetical protein RRG08_052593 [Elysia crispata]|uniref:Uncharacterized protein n=1 Tax=Elysia crispata TaxID=231223 RepID=A0AAE1DQJ1_9GAST|nr:hypothetical protein RRG08_052593 [Elysia crispata]